MKQMTGTICRSVIRANYHMVEAVALSIYSDHVAIFEYQCMLMHA